MVLNARLEKIKIYRKHCSEVDTAMNQESEELTLTPDSVIDEQWGLEVAILTPLPFHIFFLYVFVERGREGEEEGEKHKSAASFTPPTGDLACNPGICSDRKRNQRPFRFQ